MNKFIQLCDLINDRVGKVVSLLSVLLVLIIIMDVLFRYLFSITSPATFELEWHLFAVIFLLGAGWTLKMDRHVRVDLFYSRFSERNKAWVDLIGTFLLLLPFCYVGFVESLSFVQASFLTGETSPDPGGLPGRYIIKSAIPIGFLLLGLQGIAVAFRSLKKILSPGR